MNMTLMPIGTVFYNKHAGLWLRVIDHAPDAFGRMAEKCEPCDPPEKPAKAPRQPRPAKQVADCETIKISWPKEAKVVRQPKTKRSIPRKAAKTATGAATAADYAIAGEVAACGLAALINPLVGGAMLVATLFGNGIAARKHNKRKKT